MKTDTQYLYIESATKSEYLKLIQQADLPGLEVTEDKEIANIVLAGPPRLADKLDQFPNLEWVQSSSAGIDPLIQDGLRKDYLLTNVKGIFGQSISEYVLGYAIHHYRHLGIYQRQQEAQDWQPHSYSNLNEKTIVILGTGSIGSYLSHTCKAFGLTTVGVNSSGNQPQDSQFDQVFAIGDIQQALQLADIVVSVLPRTEQTKGILNSDTFSNCKDALLFNVGRGDAIETQALLEALKLGQVKHAYLDVFINEPISQQCPYWQHPQVTVTPHIAAHSFPNQIMGLFKSNYLKWVNQQPLSAIVDFNKGY
ncbi:D-2-hydroxyacid dehydrogenase [Vibrio gallicus]|uniref:D-2-hydroxyacid dehydrogenase n=1 Tax=Vibrio gallicus TaxID=190897 RepID=UPI0021C2ED47|nr:D-2-hydroxyacid dehydrogenase [Vibrio gallicus]